MYVLCAIQAYRPENDYGPLLSNGAVNWEHMQALLHVVSMYMVDPKEAGFEFPSFPMSLPQTLIVIPVVPDGESTRLGGVGRFMGYLVLLL